MSAETILIIDDDVTLLDLLSDSLRQAGYRPLAASNALQGLQLAAAERPALVVLDVMMPGMDGWEACARLRAQSPVPIILLTAKSEEIDKLRGFRLGVDDYVTKPFSFAELAARVTAVLGRSRRAHAPAHSLTSGDLVVDFDRRQATVAGRPVELTPTEYRLLEVLARNAGRTVTFEALLDAVWGLGYAGETEHVKHYIWALRKKLEADPGDPRHLLTDRGFGYRFE